MGRYIDGFIKMEDEVSLNGIEKEIIKNQLKKTSKC